MAQTPRQPNFEAFIHDERERLGREREQLLSQQQDLAGRMDALDRELAAIDAYEAAKQGKPPAAAVADGRRRPRKVAAPRGPRAARGQKRSHVLELIKQHPEGLSRGELIDKMGLKGDRSGEQSVSNALSALKKANQVDSRDGRYVAGG